MLTSCQFLRDKYDSVTCEGMPERTVVIAEWKQLVSVDGADTGSDSCVLMVEEYWAW